jgi:hypothetical protein
MELDFKEKYIFTILKDTPIYTAGGLILILRYLKLFYNGIHISAIYREIVNYQIKKYGCQLYTNSNSLKKYKGRLT